MTPTVFYLEEINRDNVNILTFKRSKHYPSATDHDLTPGRGLVEEFHGHRVSYENNFVTIEAEGHTHRLLMTDQFTVPSNDINGATSYPDEETNTTRWADYGARIRSYNYDFISSWTNSARMMIRAVVQPNGEVTKIAYEKYARSSPWAWWNGFRPNKFTTRQEITDVVYWDPGPVEGYTTEYYDAWSVEEAKRNVQPNVYSAIKSITVSTNHTTPKELRRTLFDWYNPTATPDTGSYATLIKVEDRTLLTDQLRQKTLNYWTWRAVTPSIDAALDKPFHRYLRNSFDTTGDIKTSTKRVEQQLVGGANMFYYPTETSTWVRDGLTNADLLTDHQTYAYTFADYYNMTHATYGNPSTAMKNAYGKGVATTTNTIYEPTSTTNAFRTIETSLATNMLYGSTTCTYDDTTFAESATRRALDALRNGSGAIANFSPTLNVNPFYVNHTFRLCPIWGQPTSVSVKNQLGHFIGGRDVTYQTTTACNLLVEALRGSPLDMTNYGMADATGLKATAPSATQTLLYTNGSRARLPRQIIGPQGSQIMLSYASGGAPSASRVNNAGTTTTGIAINDFDYLHDDPIAIVPTVRRMNPGGSAIDVVSLPTHHGSTVDGRERTSYGPSKVLTYARVGVADTNAMAWAPGDIPSTGWTERPPYVKLWQVQTKEDKTYAQAICVTDPLPSPVTTYDNYRLRTMEEAFVVQRLCGVTEGRTMEQNSTIYMNYVANSGDYLHRESADINDGHLRVVVTGLSAYYWTFLGKVTFSGGGLVSPVQLDYEFSRDHVFDPVLADTFAIWEIPLGEDVLTAMKAMATDDVMQIEITVSPTATNKYPFLELACHAEDAAPRLEFWKSSTIDAIVGNRPDKTAKDFTAAMIMKHADNKAEAFAKLDQSSQHVGTASYTASTASLFGRYGKGYGEYAPSNHSAKSWTIDGNPFSGTATRLMTKQMGGLNNVTSVTDLMTNTVSTTNKQYGLNTITFQDMTTRKSWDTLAAASALVASPSGFYGICYKSKVIDENGNHTAMYVDGLGRTRYVVVDSGGLDLITTYTYNTKNQLATVTNPAGQDIDYGYDQWGNVTSVTHPDFGAVRAKYNNIGQVRFTQKRTQSPGDGHAGDAVTFYQYDDLGRMTAVGEAVFESSSAFAGLDSSTINLTGTGSTYVRPTVNPSLFSGSVAYPTPPNIYPLLPPLLPNNGAGAAGCLFAWGDVRPGYEALFPFNALERTIIKPVDICVYNEAAPYGPVSAANDFEDFTDNPHNGRQGVSYDQMPGSNGSFWRSFPNPAIWNSISKTGSVRNQAGQVAAVAYRDHPYEPYRYRVYSYDERGRVECMLKLTPALGFDAVYYSYNSSDQITSIHVVDALRQYATWYGYDDNGRVSEMTSHVTAADGTTRVNGMGFYPSSGVVKPTLVARPVGAPRVTYTYDAAGNLTGKVYHDADDLDRELNTAYYYDGRWRLQQQDHSWDLDPVSSSDIYTRDNGGRITQRMSTLLDGDAYDHTYTYDNAGRLLTANVDHNLTPWKSEAYDVDDIARRTQTTKTGVVAGYTYAPLPTSATNAPTDIAPNVNGEILTDDQAYNRDGELNYRYLRPQGTAPTVPFSKEWFHYGYNDRLVKLQTQATDQPTGPTCGLTAPFSLSFSTSNKMEWQYSYSPSGEREIKRLVLSPSSDSTCGDVFPWTYYLLGTGDEQQVVYHGRQISRADCDPGGIGRRVFFYPVEYRSYGVDGVNIVWERDDNGAMVARFVGSDIQGSERYVVGKNTYQKVRDYLPFGVDVETAVSSRQRRGYLGKESDYETAPQYGVLLNAGLYHERLMDMSARKYSKTQGAFTSVDALWGRFVGTSPYAYTHHDPINFVDPSGYGEITHGGGSGGVTSGGSRANSGAWPSNWFLLGAYSSDESKAITAQDIVNRLGMGAILVAQQPQYAAKSKSENKDMQAIPAHSQQYGSKPSSRPPSQGPSFFDDPISTIWNSAPMRYLFPDIYNIGFGYSGIVYTGWATSFEANWVVRGPEASFIPIVTMTEMAGGGSAVGASINFGGYTYIGSVNDISPDMLETNVGNGPKNVTLWGSGALNAGGRVSAGGSGTYLGDGHFLIGGNIGVGLGLPLEGLPFDGVGGVSNTYILWRMKEE